MAWRAQPPGGAVKAGRTAPELNASQSQLDYLREYTPDVISALADVSTDAGNIGLYGSLIHETLVYSRATTKVHGKKVPMFASTGCKAGKHDTSTSFTAEKSLSGATQTQTVKYDGKC